MNLNTSNGDKLVKKYGDYKWLIFAHKNLNKKAQKQENQKKIVKHVCVILIYIALCLVQFTIQGLMKNLRTNPVHIFTCIQSFLLRNSQKVQAKLHEIHILHTFYYAHFHLIQFQMPCQTHLGNTPAIFVKTLLKLLITIWNYLSAIPTL